MVNYDPSIIQQHASRLYSRADALVLFYALVLGFFGLVGGFVFTTISKIDGVSLVGVGLNALFLALLGAAVGRARGFELRLQAQVALCQVQTELNTRARVVPTQPAAYHQAPGHHAPGYQPHG